MREIGIIALSLLIQWAPPKTSDGRPDLQGIWVNNGATPLERPAALKGRQSLTDEEVAEFKRRAARIFGNGNSDGALGDQIYEAILANKDRFTSPNATQGSELMESLVFDNRTSLIIDPPDGRIPALTPEAQRKQSEITARRNAPAEPEDLAIQTRCITGGVPRLGGNAAGYNSYYEILQTRDYVVIYTEVIHDARIIPVDGRPHLAESVRQWNGDSRGRWEGDTLVIDTTNFSPKSFYRGAAESLHLTERFKRVAEDTIHYEITLNDPATWMRPWTAVIYLKRALGPIFEFACHEGSSTTIEGILKGAQN